MLVLLHVQWRLSCLGTNGFYVMLTVLRLSIRLVHVDRRFFQECKTKYRNLMVLVIVFLQRMLDTWFHRHLHQGCHCDRLRLLRFIRWFYLYCCLKHFLIRQFFSREFLQEYVGLVHRRLIQGDAWLHLESIYEGNQLSIVVLQDLSSHVLLRWGIYCDELRRKVMHRMHWLLLGLILAVENTLECIISLVN